MQFHNSAMNDYVRHVNAILVGYLELILSVIIDPNISIPV